MSALASQLRHVGLVVAAWVFLFWANQGLLASLNHPPFISWIFLPAAVRMLAVMRYGGQGAVGLFLGAMLTNMQLDDAQLESAVMLSTLSAVGPLLGTRASQQILGLPSCDIHQLDGLQIYVFATAGAACNVALHSGFLWHMGNLGPWETSVAPMFMGDLAGTALVLSVLALGRAWRRPGV